MATVSENTVKKLMAAVECSQALDMKYREGRALLESHGFDDSNRFEVSATEFVAKIQKSALEAARADGV